MKEKLNEIAELTINATTDPTATELPGVMIIQGEVPQHQLATIYEPMIGFVVQGGKMISIGDRVIQAKAPSYFVIPTEIPATGSLQQDPNGQPYLSVGLSLKQNSLADLLKDLPEDIYKDGVSSEFSACSATFDFIDAWLRMLRLLRNPKHIPALAPVYEREILYHVLLGPQGWRLRHLGFASGKAERIRQAIQWMRENYAQSIEINRVAAESGLCVTTFHRRFKLITGLSPIQFQKQLRLLEARKRLVYSGHSVAEAAYEVGYESASQFNREYSRFFGAPPAKDASRLRQTEAKRQAV